MIDYHLHVIAHGDRPMTVENILKYCEVARARGVSQMGITEHDRYLEEIDLAAFQEARELSHDVELRLGIEQHRHDDSGRQQQRGRADQPASRT